MSEKAVLNKKNNVWYYTFSILSETSLVNHAFSTRHGGVSKEFYSAMNLSVRSGDTKENVDKNISVFCEAAGFDKEKIVMSNQTHSCAVKRITEKDIGTGISKPLFQEDADALITNVPGIVLMTFYADCVPVYLLDPRKKAIGLIHSGWRGTYGQIARIAAEEMGKAYGSKPGDIIAVIGPSICENCYEVSGELFDDFNQKFHGHSVTKERDDRVYLNLQQAVRYTLLSAGLHEENIVVSDICTCCNSELLFSHRASKGKRGLLAAMLSLREDDE